MDRLRPIVRVVENRKGYKMTDSEFQCDAWKNFSKIQKFGKEAHSRQKISKNERMRGNEGHFLNPTFRAHSRKVIGLV